MTQIRCTWCGDDPLYVAYHNKEWSVPVRDGHKLFKMLILEGAQTGLSRLIILKKRDHYRRVFDYFDPHLIAAYDAAKIAELLTDPGIVFNRIKITSSLSGRAFVTPSYLPQSPAQTESEPDTSR